jgi:hypothetical protein
MEVVACELELEELVRVLICGGEGKEDNPEIGRI